jgi:hypothetical protein
MLIKECFGPVLLAFQFLLNLNIVYNSHEVSLSFPQKGGYRKKSWIPCQARNDGGQSFLKVISRPGLTIIITRTSINGLYDGSV